MKIVATQSGPLGDTYYVSTDQPDDDGFIRDFPVVVSYRTGRSYCVKCQSSGCAHAGLIHAKIVKDGAR